jgi:hypothetical protein
MPGGDGTGPMGMGSRTGRGMGFCNGYNSPGFASQGFGRRFFSGGRGMGRGFRWRQIPIFQQPIQQTKEQERQLLENDKRAIEEERKSLEQEAEAIKKRLEELDKQQ